MCDGTHVLYFGGPGGCDTLDIGPSVLVWGSTLIYRVILLWSSTAIVTPERATDSLVPGTPPHRLEITFGGQIRPESVNRFSSPHFIRIIVLPTVRSLELWPEIHGDSLALHSSTPLVMPDEWER